MGRKTKFTPETVCKLTTAIQMGATNELACHYAGIDPSTFYRWLESNCEFCKAVKEAEGKAAIGWLAKIEGAANNGIWQAAAWKLERRYPQQYGRRALELTGKDSSPLTVEVSDAKARLAERLARASR